MKRLMAIAWMLAASAVPASAHHAMEGRTPTTPLQGLLSGLGHPVIGLDHLAALVAAGCIASLFPRGALLALSFVVAVLSGAALHRQSFDIPAMEIAVAASVAVLGLVLVVARPFPPIAALILFVLAGAIHGYALGESIVGAEPAPLYAYFAGLAIVQSATALGAMMLAHKAAGLSRGPLRAAGALVAIFGIVLVIQQIAAA